FAGVRTFPVIALAGAIPMLLEDRVGPALLVATFLAIAAVAVVSYVRTSAHGRIGATTEMAALATFLLGALAGAGQLVVAGAAGGLVSSTAIAISLAERSHAGAARPAAAAAVLASTIMCVRMAALAGAVDPGILPRLLPILTVMAVAGGAAAWLMGRGAAGQTSPVDGTLTNPFSLKAALTFAALYTLVLLGVRVAEEHLGAGGLY